MFNVRKVSRYTFCSSAIIGLEGKEFAYFCKVSIAVNLQIVVLHKSHVTLACIAWNAITAEFQHTFCSVFCMP